MAQYDVTQSSIDPPDWIAAPLDATEGEPDGRIHFLRRKGSEGNTYMSGVFTVQPSVVRSTIVLDETVLVLEGQARLELDDGQVLELGPGDVAFLAKGTKLHWHFLTPFKELFVVAGDGEAPDIGL
jgi:hypothetical protein